MKREIKTPQVTTPEFSRLVQEFKEVLEKDGKDEVYVGQHTYAVKEFLEWLEKRDFTRIKSIHQEQANEYIKYLEEERLSERTQTLLSIPSVNKHKGAIMRFWKFLGGEGYNPNPLNLKMRKKEKQKAIDVLSRQEIEWLYEATDDTAFGYRDRCMLALYYGCGLRRSEGLRLVVPDIDFSKGRILIRLGKNGRDRYVMMSPVVQRFVEQYVYEARDLYLPETKRSERLLISERGKPVHPESIRFRMKKLWSRVREKHVTARMAPGIHLLRHSLGTHLYMAGMDVEKVALMLGHRTLEATQLYIRSANRLRNEQI